MMSLINRLGKNEHWMLSSSNPNIKLAFISSSVLRIYIVRTKSPDSQVPNLFFIPGQVINRHILKTLIPPRDKQAEPGSGELDLRL